MLKSIFPFWRQNKINCTKSVIILISIFYKIKNICHLNLATFFMCKIVTMKFLSHFKKKLPIDRCFREILMQPHCMHRFVFLYNCTYFDVFVNTSTINFLKKSLLLSLWRMTCLFELYTIIPVFLTIIFGYKCLLT